MIEPVRTVTPSSRAGSIGLIKIGTPLSREQEESLHPLIAKGRDAALALKRKQRRNPEQLRALRQDVRRGRHAEEMLLAATCALVKQRVNALGFPFDQDELEAAGVEGVVKALREFDPGRGVRFSTYANYWISKMVMATISNRVPYPESDLRLVIKFRRLQRQHSSKSLSVAEVMRHLQLSRAQASRIVRMSGDIAAGMAQIDSSHVSRIELDASDPWPESEWVIDLLKEILGDDFTDFWMWTGRVMSLEELGRKNDVSKQAMAKRVRKWRQLVENSPHADRMISWLRAQ